MKKGIIMEIRRDVLILMTPDGQFMNGKKTPNQRYTIGEEIPIFPVKGGSQLKVKRNWKTAASILTAAVLILTLFSVSLLQSNKAYAYVSVDINPSLELSLNKEQQVIDIAPYNEDGEVMIEKLGDWEREDVSVVAEEILRISEKLGYLKKDQNVWITSTFTDLSESQTHSAFLKELNEFVKQYNDQHSAEIIMKETTEDIREEAIKKGVTAGTLLKETVNKENEVMANPDKDKEEIPLKAPDEGKKATVPAASNGGKQQAKQEEKDKNTPNGLQQDKKAGYNENSNSKKDQNRPANRGKENNKQNDESHKDRNQSDNRSNPNETRSDDRGNNSNGHEGKSNHYKNNGNHQQKDGSEHKGNGEKGRNH
jgi:hypothetical protein